MLSVNNYNTVSYLPILQFKIQYLTKTQKNAVSVDKWSIDLHYDYYCFAWINYTH